MFPLQYTNKDRYLYYHCIRNDPYNAIYQCQSYDDPLTIPKPEKEHIESIIFPMRRIFPIRYHIRTIRKELQERIQVEIVPPPTFDTFCSLLF
jgi:hypothetical protein